MRILILGATGMLGYQIFKTCIDRNITALAVVRNKQLLLDNLAPEFSDRIGVIDDVKNIAAIAEIIASFKPDYLVNCVGIIKQSPLAENHYESIAVNSFLPHQLARLSVDAGFRLIHISTDCVFDGRKGMYKETDPSDAYDLYGKTKYLGEVNYGQAITLRTSIIGHELAVSKHGLVDWFLSQEKKVNGFSKAIFSGVTTLELTRIILDVLSRPEMEPGLYQVASKPISKLDLLKIIAEVYKKEIEIVPTDNFVIDRSLDGSRFQNVTGYQIADWPTMVTGMHDGFNKHFKSAGGTKI
jgi:dTDP-4-dehydrorhamnose reductase